MTQIQNKEDRDLLKGLVYSKSGRSINARACQDWITKNTKIDFGCILLDTAHLSEHLSISTRIIVWVNEAEHKNNCPTCGTKVYKWIKGYWQHHCSKNCAQADPNIKSKISESLSKVDWIASIEKRTETTLEKYGVESYSQTSAFKDKMSLFAVEIWKDKERIEQAKIARAKTNLEKYGTENVSSHPDLKRKQIKSQKETLALRSKERLAQTYKRMVVTKYGEEYYNKINNRELLYDMHVNRLMSINAICEELGCHWGAVRTAFGRLAIPYNPNRDIFYSKEETQLFEYISSIAKESIERSFYREYQLDLYIPSMNIGFELNGCYWHSAAHKDKLYHYEKMISFENLGIRYIQIWDDVWINRRSSAEKFISNLINPMTFDLDKCSVKEVSEAVYNDFIYANHIDLPLASELKFGLFLEDELISVIGLNRITEREFIIADLCDLNIAGALNLLIEHFKKNVEWESVTVDANLDYVFALDNCYLDCGFVALGRIEPTPLYYSPYTKMRSSEFPKREERIVQKNVEFDSEIEAHVQICYDSGKMRFQLKRT